MKFLRSILYLLFGSLAVLFGCALFAAWAAYSLAGEVSSPLSFLLLLPGAGGMIWTGFAWLRKGRSPAP